MPASKPSDGPQRSHSDTIPSAAEVTIQSDETQCETKHETQILLRLDAEHLAALDRVRAHEHLKRNDTLKRLIRVADQLVSGDQSPFKSLELAISSRKVG